MVIENQAAYVMGRALYDNAAAAELFVGKGAIDTPLR